MDGVVLCLVRGNKSLIFMLAVTLSVVKVAKVVVFMVCRESLNVSFMVNKSSIFMLPVTLSVAKVAKVAGFSSVGEGSG